MSCIWGPSFRIYLPDLSYASLSGENKTLGQGLGALQIKFPHRERELLLILEVLQPDIPFDWTDSRLAADVEVISTRIEFPFEGGFCFSKMPSLPLFTQHSRIRLLVGPAETGKSSSANELAVANTKVEHALQATKGMIFYCD
ncbi:hypothetical protein CIHG_05472 [Coccidioides immitis H538.4]|uniref:Uncharacterized protein n=1 Tax=Coccidioides immitis H538.4 TaxID=396776 RepID=A0A0J8RRA0_COCIT|nr:hypothetical protein CIHG_05472 [Coccidioides immitis H538.4]